MIKIIWVVVLVVAFSGVARADQFDNFMNNEDLMDAAAIGAAMMVVHLVTIDALHPDRAPRSEDIRAILINEISEARRYYEQKKIKNDK